MRKKLHYVLLAALLLGSVVTTQAQKRPVCATMDVLQRQITQNPLREKKLKRIEDFIQQQLPTTSTVLTIPVVVHVVYHKAVENISEAQISSQIKALNDDFRRLNADAVNTPAIFRGIAADVELEFCMANVDPNGFATNGITRTYTSRSSFGTDDAVMFSSSGGKDAWPASDYLNIWVCHLEEETLGYAQFPGGAPATDGVVIGYKYFGTIGTAEAPYNKGRTLTHEVGHWLNLLHIWGDGGCRRDDNVSDTPLAGQPNYSSLPCDAVVNSCGSGANDLPDMYQNYMDYSDDACMNLFTIGQKNRMRALFAPGGARYSLLSSAACAGNGRAPSCSDGLQNGTELGVDCGGPCAACSSGCTHPLATNYASNVSIEDGSCKFSWSICQPVNLEYCYQNNEDLVVTFCPETPNQKVEFHLQAGYLENSYDRLRLYDNATTTGNLLLQATGQLPTRTYTATNSSGCLTLRLTSDGSYSCLTEDYQPLKFMVKCAGNVGLPLELNYFSGKVLEKTNVLHWVTGSEKQTAVHIIERLDGTSDQKQAAFKEIGRMDAAGYSSTLTTYEWEDKKPPSKAYYRLRTLDSDGTEHLSSTIYLQRLDSKEKMTVLPIPARETVLLNYESEGAETLQLTLLDLTGRSIRKQEWMVGIQQNTLRLDVADLPEGMYWILVENGRERFVKKLIISN